MADNMDQIAQNIVRDWMYERVYVPSAATDPDQFRKSYTVFVVWKCKSLQNWKYILATNYPDERLFELTYNGDKREWYLDTYEKAENRVYADNRNLS
jgi:hypothetical protein